jgi:hypothetical protein
MLQTHPELARDDLIALLHYARAPVGLRQSFGGCAEDAEDLETYLESTRQQRKTGRREVDD